MPFTARILLMALVFALSSGLGMAGGNKPARMPMGASGVTLGVARLLANALTSFNPGSDDDDHYQGESVQGGDALCSYAGDDDDDSNEEGEDTGTVDKREVAQVSPEAERVFEWLENHSIADLLTNAFRESLVPALEGLGERGFLFFMRRDDEYLIRTLLCIFSFGSEAQRVEVLALLPRLLQPAGENQNLMLHDRSRMSLLMDLLMDKLFSENQTERNGARRFALSLLEREYAALDVFLKAITGRLRYSPAVRWEREPVVWSDLGGLLIDVARLQEEWIQSIVHAVIKEIYLHLRYDGDENLKHAIEAFLVHLTSNNQAFKQRVMLALFELFREVGLAALELYSMIPVGTLQDYQVEPIFNIMKAIAGNGYHWIEQVALFAILQENDKLRHALNKCLIQWVREETMPPSVRYQVAMWLAGNTGRLFEYGPQSEVLRILLRWAESDDAGWLSLEQRMDVYAVTLVNGCSKHQERARALVCNLDEPERVCWVVMDIISRLRMKEAKVIDYRFDLESLMESMMRRDPEFIINVIECSVLRFLAEQASGRQLSLSEVDDPIVCLLSSAMGVILNQEDEYLVRSCLAQVLRIEGTREMHAEVLVDGAESLLRSLQALSEESINWVLSMLNEMSLDILIDLQRMRRLMEELQSSKDRDAQRLYASIVELQEFLKDFMPGESFTFKHLMYALVSINKANEEANTAIERMEAFIEAFNSE